MTVEVPLIKLMLQVITPATALSIPYYDKHDKLCYLLQLTFYKKENIEKVALLIYEDEVFTKFIQFKDQLHTTDFSLFNRLNEIQYNKLNQIEDIIDKIEDGTIKDQTGR